jgi:phospholipid-binding lipoprotein MlaA
MKSSPAVLGPVSALAAAALLGGCVTASANPEDPYEDFNRGVFAFNDQVDKALVEPVAKGYRAVTNEPIRNSFTNFLNNLAEPVTFTNEVLQGKVGNAAGTVGRFVINTTVGIAGIFNPAEAIGIKRTDEDFGQTLGTWGVPSGPYLVLPFLGPTNPRDLTGLGADIAMDPINYLEFEGDSTWRTGILVGNGLSAREEAIESFDTVRQQVDPYTTVRRFYVRSRADAIGTSDPEPRTIEEVPDFELDF